MKKITLLFSLLVALLILAIPVHADGEPYPTWIQGPSEFGYLSQAAYTPSGVLTNVQFGKISDMKLNGSNIYVVDSQKKAVYVLNQSGKIIQTIVTPQFQQPTGLAIDKQGNLYVADPTAKKIFKFSSQGNLLNTFTRPTDPLFGTGSAFSPSKIAVDSRGEMYIVGVGTTEGLIVLSNKGEFLGYFGGNQAQETIVQQLQGIFGQGFGLKGALNNIAPAPSNVYIDKSGIVYTTTNDNSNGGIKKLNLAGQNMLSGASSTSTTVAVTTDADGNIDALDNMSQILQFDASGDSLFEFGTQSNNGDQIGTFKNASAIAVSTDGVIYIADSETNLIHKLKPTTFGAEVLAGVSLINNGKYNSAKSYFEKIATQNSNFVLAYNSIANADLLQGNYKEAEEYYYTAQNKVGYSNAFWYIRQNWLDNNLGYLILALILIFLLIQSLKILHRRTRWFVKFDYLRRRIYDTKIADELRDLPRMMRHPIDTFYSFNYEGRGSLRAANIWLIILLIEVGIYLIFTGYIFNSEIVQQVSIFFLIGVVCLSLFVFVLINYLVASITDGEGSLKTVYISTIHSLAPLILLILPIVVLTNILTFNESFIITYAVEFVVGWSVLLLSIMISKIHDFSFGATIKNILLTLFAIAVMLFTLYVLWVLAGQLVNFIKTIMWEISHG